MKRILSAALVAAAAAFASPALAKTPAHPAAVEHTSSGVVTNYAPNSRILTLRGGKTYKLATNISATPSAGEQVQVRWTKSGSTRLADMLTIK